jgi:hypothetical protein
MRCGALSYLKRKTQEFYRALHIGRLPEVDAHPATLRKDVVAFRLAGSHQFFADLFGEGNVDEMLAVHMADLSPKQAILCASKAMRASRDAGKATHGRGDLFGSSRNGHATSLLPFLFDGSGCGRVMPSRRRRRIGASDSRWLAAGMKPWLPPIREGPSIESEGGSLEGSREGDVGSKRLIVRVLQPLWTMGNEWALGIRTTPAARSGTNQAGVDPVGQQSDVLAQHNDSGKYEVPDYWYMRKVRGLLRAGPEDVIFDLGCGMGRFLCVMARRKVRKCVGVELVPQLCEIARENAARLRGRKAPIEIQCGDAASADLSAGTIYYMYNPFGPATMKDVLASLSGTLSRNPRKITIAYYNSVGEELFQNSGWLEKYDGFRVQSGMPVTFWRNRQAAG